MKLPQMPNGLSELASDAMSRFAESHAAAGRMADIAAARLTTGTSAALDAVQTAAEATSRSVGEIATTASETGARAVTQVVDAIRHLDRHREGISEHAGDIAKATRVIAGVATVGAAAAAPTGLAAVGVALGVTSAPFIVTAAPFLIAVAGAAASVSAATALYAKSRRDAGDSAFAGQAAVDPPPKQAAVKSDDAETSPMQSST